MNCSSCGNLLLAGVLLCPDCGFMNTLVELAVIDNILDNGDDGLDLF